MTVTQCPHCGSEVEWGDDLSAWRIEDVQRLFACPHCGGSNPGKIDATQILRLLALGAFGIIWLLILGEALGRTNFL